LTPDNGYRLYLEPKNHIVRVTAVVHQKKVYRIFEDPESYKASERSEKEIQLTVDSKRDSLKTGKRQGCIRSLIESTTYCILVSIFQV
jgi:hypothetical protein